MGLGPGGVLHKWPVKPFETVPGNKGITNTAPGGLGLGFVLELYLCIIV